MIAKIRTGLALLFFGSATLVLATLQMLALRTGLFNTRVMPRLWHASMIKALGMRVHVSGAMAKKRPLMIAANHVSWTDIAVLGSLVDVSFIAKSEVSRWPVMGALSKLQRTYFVERERKRHSDRQASEIAKRPFCGACRANERSGATRAPVAAPATRRNSRRLSIRGLRRSGYFATALRGLSKLYCDATADIRLQRGARPSPGA